MHQQRETARTTACQISVVQWRPSRRSWTGCPAGPPVRLAGAESPPGGLPVLGVVAWAGCHHRPAITKPESFLDVAGRHCRAALALILACLVILPFASLYGSVAAFATATAVFLAAARDDPGPL